MVWLFVRGHHTSYFLLCLVVAMCFCFHDAECLKYLGVGAQYNQNLFTNLTGATQHYLDGVFQSMTQLAVSSYPFALQLILLVSLSL